MIPDQFHINEISGKLWNGREFGQAAVMIGSGFSRNAELASPNTSLPPLLEDLAHKIFEALYPSGSLPPYERTLLESRSTTGTAIMKLASEYRTAFSPAALDDLLLKALPDASYAPGLLHKLLLSLPWSDVFTTNYDTLLERDPSVYSRSQV